jgi:hypothetical protein
VPVQDATVKLFDAAFNLYQTITDVNGDAPLVVPQYVVTGTGPTITNRNPYSLQITKPGCDTTGESNISITGPVTRNITISCP